MPEFLLYAFVLSVSVMTLLTLHPAYSDDTTGVMIPLYIKPGPEWNGLISEKIEHQSVPFVVIINPNNGPGISKNDNYSKGIQDLRSAGISVLGYVHTNYTNRDTGLVQNDIDSYASWYPQLNGIFFDEMSHVLGDEAYYSNLDNYTKQKGLGFSVGNAGTITLPSYIGVMDNIVVYDFNGIPSPAFFEACCANYDKSNFTVLAYGVDTLDQNFVKNATNYVSYMYLTNDTLPNQWDTIPPYFDSLVSLLDNATAPIVPPNPSHDIKCFETHLGWKQKDNDCRHDDWGQKQGNHCSRASEHNCKDNHQKPSNKQNHSKRR